MRYGLILVAVLMGCAAPPPKVPTIQERVSGAYQPNSQDRTQLYQRIQTYWAALAAGDWAKAYEFHTYDYRERLPLPVWQRQHVALANPRPVSIHWTKGAHRQFGPELYAIVDWTDDNSQTGRLIWRQDDGVFWIEN